MKNTVKAGLYAAAGSTLLALNTVSAAMNVKGTKADSNADNGTGGDFIGTLDNIFGYIIGLLYFFAIAFALYGGFQILTAGGDEDKVKGGKTTLINAVIGLIVIFLSSQIINWVISLGTDGTIVGA